MSRLAKVQENPKFLSNILTAMVDILVVFGADGTIQMVNRATEELLGYTQEQLKQKSAAMIFPEELCDEVNRWLEIVRQRKHTTQDTFLLASNGDRILVGASLSPVVDEDEVVGIICVARDLREIKRMEGQLLQGQKLEAIGQLAAGVAHEINTPMQYIRDNLEFLENSFKDLMQLDGAYREALASGGGDEQQAKIRSVQQEIDLEYLVEEIPKSIAQTTEGIGHVTDIVRSLKAFSHPGTEEMEHHDLSRLLQDTIRVAKNAWKYVAEVKTQFDSTLPEVPCHIGELNQVILNLIVNAAHAIEDVLPDADEAKGVISISTHRLHHMAQIRIQDTGGGIPEEIQDKIYDPFFTTKGVGKGTGQGLAIARAIVVDKHRGTLSLDSKPGQTTFIIEIPLTQELGN